MQTQKDKLILDTSDNADLADYFSKKEPGDKCRVTEMTVSLDSNEDGTVILSVDPDEKITIAMPKGDKAAKADTADSAAGRMYASKAADDETEEPTPDDEENETPA